MKTKTEVLEWAKVHDLTLLYSDKAYYKWVCVYAPFGQRFVNSKSHELSLWNERARPDWRLIGMDLMDNTDLAPCTLEVCEVCHAG